VPVPVRVGFAGRVCRGVQVLVVFVMNMKVFVFENLVTMKMRMFLGQVQENSDAHKCSGDPEENAGASHARQRREPRR